jgi:hypothetical protein
MTSPDFFPFIVPPPILEIVMKAYSQPTENKGHLHNFPLKENQRFNKLHISKEKGNPLLTNLAFCVKFNKSKISKGGGRCERR